MNPQVKKFAWDGKEFEIRAAHLKEGWEAAVFFEGKKISFDYCEPLNESSVEVLLSALESDVKRGNIAPW